MEDTQLYIVKTILGLDVIKEDQLLPGFAVPEPNGTYKIWKWRKKKYDSFNPLQNKDDAYLLLEEVVSKYGTHFLQDAMKAQGWENTKDPVSAICSSPPPFLMELSVILYRLNNL